MKISDVTVSSYNFFYLCAQEFSVSGVMNTEGWLPIVDYEFYIIYLWVNKSRHSIYWYHGFCCILIYFTYLACSDLHKKRNDMITSIKISINLTNVTDIMYPIFKNRFWVTSGSNSDQLVWYWDNVPSRLRSNLPNHFSKVKDACCNDLFSGCYLDHPPEVATVFAQGPFFVILSTLRKAMSSYLMAGQWFETEPEKQLWTKDHEHSV